MSITPEKPIISKIMKDNMAKLLEENKRLDGRSLTQYRDISFATDVIQKAEGSAQVNIGHTKVLVGVKMGTGAPFPDTPNQGVLTVNAELLPLASPTFEPGPPDERAIALARYVDRSVRESEAIDLESLVVIPGKLVHIVYIDVYVLDYDGNLIDASVLAAVKALETTKFKKVIRENDQTKFSDELVPLPLKERPVSVTTAVVDNKLIVDPDLIEEQAAETLITFTFTEAQDIVAVMKNDQGFISPEQVLEALKISIEKARELANKMGWWEGG